MTRGQRGFTLLELVLALAILGAMVAVLFGGLRVGLRAWQRGEDGAQVLQHQRSLAQLLAQAIAGAHAYQSTAETGGQPAVLFQGESDRVSFVSVAPPLPLSAPIAFTAVTVSMDTDPTPGLAIREKALPNHDPFEDLGPMLVDATTTAVRFRYLRDAGGAWEESWDATVERSLPRAVEITVTTTVSGQPVEQPPLVVAIRAVTP